MSPPQLKLIDRAKSPTTVYDGFSELWFDSRELTTRGSDNAVITALMTQIEMVSGAVRLLIDRHARREYVVLGLPRGTRP